MTADQIVVVYNDNTIMYYPVGPERPWRIDGASRCLVIGRGLSRTYVPLDQARSFDIEAAGLSRSSQVARRCPSCDHAVASHSGEGCWYAVTEAPVGRDVVCPCFLPNGVEAVADDR